MKIILCLVGLLAAGPALAADNTVLAVTQVSSDGKVTSSQLQMDSAAACQSGKQSLQGFYDYLTAQGYQAVVMVSCR